VSKIVGTKFVVTILAFVMGLPSPNDGSIYELHYILTFI
jgi:hypothetical protein